MTTLQAFSPQWLRDRDNADKPWGLKLPDGREIPVSDLVSGAGKRTLAVFGDSLGEAMSYSMGALNRGLLSFYVGLVPANINSGSTLSFIPRMLVDARALAGTGTLTFTPIPGRCGTLRWTAPGDTAGPAIEITNDGFWELPSGSPNKAAWVAIRRYAVDTQQWPATAQTDSITLSSNVIECDNITESYATWGNILAGGGGFETVYNFGIYGDTPENLLNRIQQVIAVSPDVVVELSGTNNLTETTIARWKAAKESIWQQLTSRGINVVAVTIFPRGDAPAGITKARRNNLICQLNRWIFDTARKYPRVTVADGYAALVDVNNATAGEPVAAYFNPDKIHLYPQGAYAVGKYALGPALAKLVGPSTLAASSPSDVWDATYNPGGNLIPSGFGNFVGAAAGGDITPGTGTLGAGWKCLRSATTMAIAMTSPSDGSPVPRAGRAANWQRLVVTGTGAAALDSAEINALSAIPVGNGYAVGDRIRFSGAMRISNLNNIQALYVRLQFQSAPTTANAYGFQSLAFEPLALLGDTVDVPFCSQPIRVPEGTTGIKIQVQIYSGAGASTCTLDLQDFDLRNLTALGLA